MYKYSCYILTVSIYKILNYTVINDALYVNTVCHMDAYEGYLAHIYSQVVLP